MNFCFYDSGQTTVYFTQNFSADADQAEFSRLLFCFTSRNTKLTQTTTQVHVSQTILIVTLTLMLIMVTLLTLLLSVELFHLILATGIQLLSLHLGFPVECLTVLTAGLAYETNKVVVVARRVQRCQSSPHKFISFSCGESYGFLDPPSVVAKSKMTLLILFKE